jgi:HSP20 family protein
MPVLTKRNGHSVANETRSRSQRAFPTPFEMLPEFDRLFSMMRSAFPVDTMMSEQVYVPPIDISEKDGTYTIEAAIPGFRKDDVSIEVDSNQVTISGDVQESSDDRSSRRYSELRRSSFTRTISLPRDVDPDRAKADFQNGMLTITVPSATPVNSRKLEISSR